MQEAICPFCGQCFYSDETDKVALRMEAIQRCDCDEAKKECRLQEYVTKAKNQLKGIFCLNFSGIEMTQNTQRLKSIEEKMSLLLEHMARFEVYSVTANIDGIGKLSMTIKNSGEIKIKRVVSAYIERTV